MNTSAPIFTLDQILEATRGTLLAGQKGLSFEGVSTDSRKIQSRNIFIAIAGDNFDGHHFIPAAVKSGAACVIAQNKEALDLKALDPSICIVLVDDTVRALGDLAHAYRMRFDIPVIGLTGSSGKTTTKEILASILEGEKRVLKTQGNLNNLIGLPQTLFGLTNQHDIAIVEMGTNTRGEIKRLTQIASPDIGLITNIGPAHLAGFGTIETVRQEKGDLFLNMEPSKTIVVNLDDEAVDALGRQWSGRRVTYSMTANADVTVGDVRKNGARGMSFSLHAGGEKCKVDMKVVGIHSIYNAMAASAAAMAAGCSMESIRKGLVSFQPVGGRMEIIRLQNGAFVINDAYNANPASVREALLTLKDLKGSHNAFVLLGDMLELGDSASEMHRKIGMLVATTGVTAIFLQGDFAGMTAAGALDGGLTESQVMFIKDDEDVMAFFKKQLRKGDWILIKGSRRMKMDRMVARLCAEWGDEKCSAAPQVH